MVENKEKNNMCLYILKLDNIIKGLAISIDLLKFISSCIVSDPYERPSAKSLLEVKKGRKARVIVPACMD